MRTDLEALTIDPLASIRQGMKRIDENRAGIVLVVDEQGVLLGTVTDGDVRRAILKSASLEAPLTTIMTTSPTVLTLETNGAGVESLTLDDATRKRGQELMASKRLRHLPVLTVAERVVVGLLSLDDSWGEVGDAERMQQATTPLSAVVMAGGLGSRLRPLTQTTPKPLLPVGGKPILERIVEHLHGSGVDQMVITTRYMAEQVEGYFQQGDAWGVQIDYIREQERRGTAGALRELVGRVEHPFLVMNGDLLTDFSVQEMYSFHREHQAVMTVGVRQYAFQVPYGVAEVEGVHIRALSEKPTYDFFVNAGIYILEPRLLDMIPDRYFDITELIEELVKCGEPVVSFPIHEQWMDIGRPEDLEVANAMFQKERDRSEEDA